MSEIAGIITNRVVPLTRNEKTRAFIGRMVLRLHRQGRIFYRIEGTEYVLTPVEYDIFLKRKVIVKDSPEVAEATSTVAAPTTTVASGSLSESSAMSSSVKTAAAEVVENRSMLSASKAMRNSTAKILSNFSKNLSDTTFFDAVKPEFKIEQPKGADIFEKRDMMVENARAKTTAIAGKLKNGFASCFQKIGDTVSKVNQS